MLVKVWFTSVALENGFHTPTDLTIFEMQFAQGS
jgi:hypothetical protein